MRVRVIVNTGNVFLQVFMLLKTSKGSYLCPTDSREAERSLQCVGNMTWNLFKLLMTYMGLEVLYQYDIYYSFWVLLVIMNGKDLAMQSLQKQLL